MSKAVKFNLVTFYRNNLGIPLAARLLQTYKDTPVVVITAGDASQVKQRILQDAVLRESSEAIKKKRLITLSMDFTNPASIHQTVSDKLLESLPRLKDKAQRYMCPLAFIIPGPANIFPLESGLKQVSYDVALHTFKINLFSTVEILKNMYRYLPGPQADENQEANSSSEEAAELLIPGGVKITKEYSDTIIKEIDDEFAAKWAIITPPSPESQEVNTQQLTWKASFAGVYEVIKQANQEISRKTGGRAILMGLYPPGSRGFDWIEKDVGISAKTKAIRILHYVRNAGLLDAGHIKQMELKGYDSLQKYTDASQVESSGIEAVTENIGRELSQSKTAKKTETSST